MAVPELFSTRLRNTDLGVCGPPGLQPVEEETADQISAGPTGNMPVFRSRPESADPKPFHQLLAQIGLDIGPQTAQHFFAANRIHRDELAQKFIARSLFLVPAPGHASGKKQTDDPNDDRAQRNFGQHQEQSARKTGRPQACQIKGMDSGPASSLLSS